MRILLTGVTGFAGGYLAEALLARGETELHGLARRPVWPEQGRHLADRVALHACDLADRAAVEALLRQVQPDRIYHLAGFARTGQSYQEPDAAWADNLGASRNLYEAIIRWGGRPRILHVSSGLVYGDSLSPEAGVDELAVPRPTSPYAASKAAADLAAFQYTCSPGLAIVRVRPFNHIGPRQSAEFAVPNFARQIVAIQQGRQPPQVQTGNLDTRRDLTDVRDMTHAYLLLMEKGRVGEVYNAGSGTAHLMRDILERLAILAGVAIEVSPRVEPARAVEAAALRADAGKLRRETGWAPTYSLEQTLRDTLEHWRGDASRASL